MPNALSKPQSSASSRTKSPHRAMCQTPPMTPATPSFGKRLSTLLLSASTFTSKSSRRQRLSPSLSSGSSYTLVSLPSAPPSPTASIEQAVGPLPSPPPPSYHTIQSPLPTQVSMPIETRRVRQHRDRRTPLERKRELLCSTLVKGSDLPEHTIYGIRHILVEAVPDVFAARESLYIDIDDLPMHTIDQLYSWMVGHRI